MSANILHFPGAERIEIWSGRTKEQPDRLTYFIDYVEPDGGRCGVWEGDTWSAARLASFEWQRHGMRVVDKTGGAA